MCAIERTKQQENISSLFLSVALSLLWDNIESHLFHLNRLHQLLIVPPKTHNATERDGRENLSKKRFREIRGGRGGEILRLEKERYEGKEKETEGLEKRCPALKEKKKRKKMS